MKYFFNIIFYSLILSITISCHTHDRNKYKSKKSNYVHIKEDLFSHLDTNKYYKIKKVVDGDTFWIDDETEKGKKIRLIGIDAPETRNTSKKKKSIYGEKSKQYLIQLIQGQRVRLEFDINKLDRYNRYLAYAYLENGTFINDKLIKAGMAMVYTVPPNIKYVDQFIISQSNARNNQIGIWENYLEI